VTVTGGFEPSVNGSARWVGPGYEPQDPTYGELSVDERRALVRRIADQVGTRVSARVQAALEAGAPMSEAAEMVSASTEIQQALRVENERRVRGGMDPLTERTHMALVDMVMAHSYELAELQELWLNPEVEEIDANGFDTVFVTFAGGLVKRWTSIAANEEEFLELIRRIARRLGLIEVQFDARHPKLDMPLPDGSRLFAVYGGAGTNGVGVSTYLCIRRHRFLRPSADQMVELGVWPQQASDFVVAALRAGENVIVAGDWSAGKTTLLRALIYSAVQRWERIVTIEAGITELGLHRPRDPNHRVGDQYFDNVVALFSRPKGAEGEGEVTVWELVEEYSRRLNGARVFVGEVMGQEVGPVLDTLTSNTRGSACTIHARDAQSVIGRFAQYGLAANPPISTEAVHLALNNARPIIVHLAGDVSVEGTVTRYCTSIMEVTGGEDARVATTELWGLDDHNRLVPQHAVSTDRRRRMGRRGWDWTVHGWAAALPVGDPR
jgi:pilus assembly protein CpaF